MRFAFDIDGVVTEMPDFFSAVTSALKAAGHQIVLVTDFDENFRTYREQELAKYGIAYDELVITSQKEKYFRSNTVDYAMDDDAEYYPNLRRISVFLFSKQ